MSGVYINMEMPKSCSRCFCMASCKLWKNIIAPEFNRHRNCPLVPVPPHGRLIDADALTVKLQRHREYHSDGSKSGAAISNGIGQCLDIINGKECPTIIPAEEGVKRCHCQKPMLKKKRFHGDSPSL